MPLPSSAALPPLRRRAAISAGVLALHGLLLIGLVRQALWSDRLPAANKQAPLVVHLLTLALPQAQRQPERSVTKPAARVRAPALSSAEPTPVQTLPDTAVAQPQAITPPPESAPRPADLDLSLPRSASAPWRQRHPALDDPRANTAQATFEQRLAQAMGGDGRWTQERLDNDRIRYRRGNECFEVKRSRAGQLDLANGAFKDLWAARGC